MGMPKPGTEEYEKMVDFMRADLDNNFGYSKMIERTRQILADQGRDFDEEFKKWMEKEEKKDNEHGTRILQNMQHIYGSEEC
jgi:hypothetical protein